jgi:copper transport protein
MQLLARTARTAVVSVALAFLGLTVPASAKAHGHLKSSAPSSGAHLSNMPREIRLDFSEVPELAFSRLVVRGPAGDPIAIGTMAYAADSRRAVVAKLPMGLQAGEYRVEWQLAGDDGHPVRGNFAFMVMPGAGAAGLTPEAAAPLPESGAAVVTSHHDPREMPSTATFGVESWAYVGVRWLHFIAVFIAIGAVAFRLLILGRLHGADARVVVSAGERKVARLGVVTGAALLILIVARLLVQSLAMHGFDGALDPTLVVEMVRRTRWGTAWIMEAVSTAILLSASVQLSRVKPESEAKGATRPHIVSSWGMCAIAVTGLALASALSGHAAAVPQLRVLAVFSDTVHVMAASSWLGSLTVLLLAGIPAAHVVHTAGNAVVAQLVRRFSNVALARAATAMVTGTFAAWIHVGRVPNLWGTRYGLLLLAKLGVLGIVALTGLYNWRRVLPSLGSSEATARLQRSASIEVIVAVIVLLVTAVLVATPTPLDLTM